MKHGQLIDLGFKGQYWIIIEQYGQLLAFRGVKAGTTDFTDPTHYTTSISLDVIKPDGITLHAEVSAFPAPSLWQMLK